MHPRHATDRQSQRNNPKSMWHEVRAPAEILWEGELIDVEQKHAYILPVQRILGL